MAIHPVRLERLTSVSAIDVGGCASVRRCLAARTSKQCEQRSAAPTSIACAGVISGGRVGAQTIGCLYRGFPIERGARYAYGGLKCGSGRIRFLSLLEAIDQALT